MPGKPNAGTLSRSFAVSTPFTGFLPRVTVATLDGHGEEARKRA